MMIPIGSWMLAFSTRAVLVHTRTTTWALRPSWSRAVFSERHGAATRVYRLGFGWRITRWPRALP